MLNISVVIPTYKRLSKLQLCLETILTCAPLPSEIIIHIDYGDQETEFFLEKNQYPLVRWITSNSTQGPGGGRNKLIKEAKFPLIASFDDDSWPLSKDYFKFAADIFDKYPQAAVISAQEIRADIPPKSSDNTIRETSCFQNCASLLRRDAFLQTLGYTPLRYAYGIEEADIALQILDHGWQIIEVPFLHVYHDTQLEHHKSVAINSAHISNIALLAYLRYPSSSALPLGLMQVLNRVRYAAKVGRWNGIVQGLWRIPIIIWQYRHERKPVSLETLRLSRQIASRKK